MSHSPKSPPLAKATADLPEVEDGVLAYDTTQGKPVARLAGAWSEIAGEVFGTPTVVYDDGAGVGNTDQVQGDIPADWKKQDSSLKGLVIGTSCKSIGDNAFASCTGIVGSLVIPDSVITIGQSAFDALWGLTGPLTIGSGVEEVGDFVFFDSDYTEINCYITRDVLNKVKFPVTINKTIHVRSDDDTWTAGSGQTLGTTSVSTGITVIKDL